MTVNIWEEGCSSGLDMGLLAPACSTAEALLLLSIVGDGGI